MSRSIYSREPTFNQVGDHYFLRVEGRCVAVRHDGWDGREIQSTLTANPGDQSLTIAETPDDVRRWVTRHNTLRIGVERGYLILSNDRYALYVPRGLLWQCSLRGPAWETLVRWAA